MSVADHEDARVSIRRRSRWAAGLWTAFASAQQGQPNWTTKKSPTEISCVAGYGRVRPKARSLTLDWETSAIALAMIGRRP
jgi:hypothetical protein